MTQLTYDPDTLKRAMLEQMPEFITFIDDLEAFQLRVFSSVNMFYALSGYNRLLNANALAVLGDVRWWWLAEKIRALDCSRFSHLEFMVPSTSIDLVYDRSGPPATHVPCYMYIHIYIYNLCNTEVHKDLQKSLPQLIATLKVAKLSENIDILDPLVAQEIASSPAAYFAMFLQSIRNDRKGITVILRIPQEARMESRRCWASRIVYGLPSAHYSIVNPKRLNAELWREFIALQRRGIAIEQLCYTSIANVARLLIPMRSFASHSDN